MANQSYVTSPKLTPELIAKEEYEAQLFGFTVREYSDESKSSIRLSYKRFVRQIDNLFFRLLVREWLHQQRDHKVQ